MSPASVTTPPPPSVKSRATDSPAFHSGENGRLNCVRSMSQELGSGLVPRKFGKHEPLPYSWSSQLTDAPMRQSAVGTHVVSRSTPLAFDEPVLTVTVSCCVVPSAAVYVATTARCRSSYL